MAQSSIIIANSTSGPQTTFAQSENAHSGISEYGQAAQSKEKPNIFKWLGALIVRLPKTITSVIKKALNAITRSLPCSVYRIMSRTPLICAIKHGNMKAV